MVFQIASQKIILISYPLYQSTTHLLYAQNSTYLLSVVSLGQESRHSLTGSSAHDLTRVQSRYLLCCVLIWWLVWKKSASAIIQVFGGIYPLAAIGEFSC